MLRAGRNFARTKREQLQQQGKKSDPDFTIHLGDVYYVGYVGDRKEVRENFLREKTSPYAVVKWPIRAKGSFALNGNHEMYADGNGYWRMVLPRMELEKRGSECGAAVLGETAEALGRSSATGS